MTPCHLGHNEEKPLCSLQTHLEQSFRSSVCWLCVGQPVETDALSRRKWFQIPSCTLAWVCPIHLLTLTPVWLTHNCLSCILSSCLSIFCFFRAQPQGPVSLSLPHAPLVSMASPYKLLSSFLNLCLPPPHFDMCVRVCMCVCMFACVRVHILGVGASVEVWDWWQESPLIFLPSYRLRQGLSTKPRALQ